MASEVSAKIITGGCQCGAVRYRLNAEPTQAHICHCRMCQKASGGPFMALAGVPADKFVVTRGSVSTFVSSDIAERGFCASCGTPLSYRSHLTGRVLVTIGSFDNPNALAIETQYEVGTQVHWLPSALSMPTVSIEQWLAGKNRKDVGSHQHPDRN